MEVYIGDVDTTQEEKTEMPMLGGFLRVENFKLERKARTAGGRLVIDVIATKKRLVFEFVNMRAEDFREWEDQQRLKEPREIEYQNEGGATDFEKLVVNFEGDYPHLRARTNGPWVFAQVTFVLEEI